MPIASQHPLDFLEGRPLGGAARGCAVRATRGSGPASLRVRGRVAQLARAPRLHRGGRPFESGRAHCDLHPARDPSGRRGPAIRHAPMTTPREPLQSSSETRRGGRAVSDAAGPHRRDRRRPGGLLRRGAPAEGLRGAHRGRHARAPADAVGAGALGRRARPPEDQVRDADLREDRRAPALSLLRQRRAGAPRRAARSCWSTTTRSSTRPARRPTGRWASPARSCREAGRRRSSWAGTTAHPDHPDLDFDLSCERARGDRQRQRRARRRAHADALPSRARGHRHRGPRARGARRAARSARSSSSGGAGPRRRAFTNPELRELADLADADVVVDAGGARARAGDPRAVRERDREAERGAAARLRAARTPPPAGGGSCCASCSPRSRSTPAPTAA